jgi:multidrug resistance efflux pump
MSRAWLPPVVAALAAAYTTYHVVATNRTPPPVEPPVAPTKSPFGRTLAGAGVVEAQTENIAVGAHVPGVVVEKAVQVGESVQAGDLLFRLDDRHVRADLRVREAQLAAAVAQLERLKRTPRPEEIPPSEARVRRFEAELEAAQDLVARAEKLFQTRSIGEEELVQRRQAAAAAREALNQALADDALLKQGAWAPDVAVAQAEVARAQSLVEQAKVEIERLEVRAPVAGEILQVNVRPGEYVGAPPGQPLVVLGNVQSLRVRVDIDESDIPSFRPGMPGKAFIRGSGGDPIPLRFVRVEPFVVPKRSLTRASGEQVDTRVLQVVYEIEGKNRTVYVGQLLDVYFDESAPEADPPPSRPIAEDQIRRPID